jgi:hypothetical protein
VRLVDCRFNDLTDDRLNQHASQTAAGIAAFGARCRRRTGPQYLFVPQVDELRRCRYTAFAGNDGVARSVLFDVDIQRGIGAENLAQFLRLDLMHFSRMSQAVLVKRLID